MLKFAEHLYGHALRKDTRLPSLVCRPCERRLKNAMDFRTVISKTQQEFQESHTGEVRVKRCVEISPSIQKPSKAQSVRAAVTVSEHSSSSTRTRLDFGSTATIVSEDLSAAIGGLHVQVSLLIIDFL